MMTVDADFSSSYSAIVNMDLNKMPCSRSNLRTFLRLVAFFFVAVFAVCFQPHVNAGQTFDMANSANWNIRFDGAAAGNYTTHFCTISDDFDGDGSKDIAIGALNADNNARSNSGSLYIIYNTLLRTFANGSTLDLANPANYNIRFDGALATDSLSDICTGGDLNNDGKIDLIAVAEYADNNSRTNSGSMYVIYNDLFSGYTGTGNNVDMADSSHYNMRFDADFPNSQIAGSGIYIRDIDGNGKADLTFGEGKTDNNSRVDSGSVFVIYDSLIDNYIGTGNNIDLAVSTNYNIRIDGASAGDSFSHFLSMTCEDVNNDSHVDLVMGAGYAGNNSRSRSGSIYVIYNSLITSYSGTGNNVDLAIPSNYNLRFDGSSVDETLGSGGIISGDINTDGHKDIILGALGYSAYTGAVYALDSSLFSSYVGTGNSIDLAISTNYNVRIEGGATGDIFGYFTFKSPLADIDNDGRWDLFATARSTDNNSRTDSGSFYVFTNTLFSSYTTTANRISVSDAANFSLRYDGAGAGDWFSYLRSFALSDLNGDGSVDLLVGANTADNNSRTDSGSLYIVYNFPNTATITSLTRSGSTATVKGTISATGSVTTIAGVQYRVDNNSPLAVWINCSADDGIFNSSSESYTCAISNTPKTTGTHKIYIRAVDSNGAYTAKSSYKVSQYTIAAKKVSISSVTPTVTPTLIPTDTVTETPIVTITVSPTASQTPFTTQNPSGRGLKYSVLPCIGVLFVLCIIIVIVFWLRKRRYDNI